MVFDGAEFAEFTDCSIRSVRYAVKKLRAEDNSLRFRTVFNHDAGTKGAWRLLVALESRLKYHKEPMPEDAAGRDRHTRQDLRNPEVSATPIREGYYVTQQTLSPEGEKRLKLKAKCIARRLEFVHWDNCKVDFEFNVAVGYVFGAMKDGWTEEQIADAYRIGLQRMHGTATDLGVRFQAGSTINRARRFLDATRGTAGERMTEFYRDRREIAAKVKASLAEGARGLTDPDNIIDRGSDFATLGNKKRDWPAIPRGQHHENE